MKKSKIIAGLRDLIRDRKSFVEGDADHDAVFLYDIKVLKSAVKHLKNEK